MTEHMTKMQEQMSSMKGMMAPGGTLPGAGMNPGGMKPGGMMSQRQGAATSDTNVSTQIAAMQQRMNSMQLMMEQMLQQQKLMIKPTN